jgi:cytoskeletal protein CcmA (bactofilin family)
MTDIDSHHKRAAQLAQQADLFARTGQTNQAETLYSAALAEEETALNLLKAAHAGARTLFVFQKSAATLAVKCSDWSSALRLIDEGLGMQLGPPMREELERLFSVIPQTARPAQKRSPETEKHSIASETAAPLVQTGDVLLEDVEIQGTLKHAGTLSFNGKLTGAIIARVGTINVGSRAEIWGDLFSQSALIAGKICGSITADGSCQLGPTSQVLGNITSPRLDIADGATFIGAAKIVPSEFQRGPTSHARVAGGFSSPVGSF